ncbi:MAG TPA: DUF3027 domain-containing protein [Jatrophihabitans sp.]|nr:DUF3027 domain-containing protein [Jatrophihabitans sp.]
MTGPGTTADAPARPATPDPLLAGAVELARAAAVEVGAETVGEHLGVRAEDELVATHSFASSLPGYAGWCWSVTVARVADADTITVDEVVLLPGEGALLAPAWVPWRERVRPGDLGPGDLVPPPAQDDPRLVPAYVLSDDPAVEEVAFELGLGRERVLSREGRLLAAERWYTGDSGPDTAMARHAPAHCGTCGFYLPLAGSLAAGFGVCGNEITDTDGRVVSVEYGCGAHSQVKVTLTPLAEAAEVVFDDGEEFDRA